MRHSFGTLTHVSTRIHCKLFLNKYFYILRYLFELWHEWGISANRATRAKHCLDSWIVNIRSATRATCFLDHCRWPWNWGGLVYCLHPWIAWICPSYNKTRFALYYLVCQFIFLDLQDIFAHVMLHRGHRTDQLVLSDSEHTHDRIESRHITNIVCVCVCARARVCVCVLAWVCNRHILKTVILLAKARIFLLAERDDSVYMYIFMYVCVYLCM
jgi:hypothetical protein